MPARAEADGIYFLESFGVGRAGGDLAPLVGNAMHTRIAVGARVRWLAIEPFIGTDMQTSRVGAFRGLVGGEPAEGRADLERYGVELKALAPLFRGPSGERIEAYVRGGASLVGATGMLESYRGQAVGFATGLQLTGKVRALGFLWAPLFFMNKGPKVTGALFIDQGWDFYRLRSDDDGPTLQARVGHVSIGFAIGSSF